MSLGAIFIGLTLLIPALIFVSEPFRNKVIGRKLTSPGNTLNQVDGYAETLLALRDLDFDKQTGKVTDQDYANLRTELLTRAAREMEIKKQNELELEDKLEHLIQARLQAKAASQTCPNCGRPLNKGDQFCSSCGSAQSACCPNCGHSIAQEDRFCVGCGQPIKSGAATAVNEVVQ